MLAQKTSTKHLPAAPPAAGKCFHCGEPCLKNTFTQEEKSFCCFGCQTVFNLLNENGLAGFYNLQSTPGIRIGKTDAPAKWAFLDDPAVREKLLDYWDEKKAKVTLHLPTIHCIACVWLLENLFKLHPGIGNSLVTFSRREVTITFAPDKIKFSALVGLLAAIGYEPQFTFGELENSPPAGQLKKSWLQIGLALFGFGNIMLMSLPFYFGLDSFNGPWFRLVAGWLSLALALPVVTYSAADFWRASWSALRQRTLTLEVPISIGLAAIYAASVFEVVARRGPGYCDSLTGLIFFLLCGRLFQKKTYDRLTFDRDYKGFFPLSVIRKTGDDEEVIALSQLKTGDHLLLRNGELLPADAKLISDQACIDYSFVTGESEPVSRAGGTHLFAGGRQVGSTIEVETLKPVEQSYLASLWNHDAFQKKRDRDLDSLTNKYSRRFTKLVIGIALAAAIFWVFADVAKTLKVFVSVLIVACPCALALAAPLTHGTAQRIMARRKFFLKNALVVEHLAEVDTIVFDKTGTLTISDTRDAEFLASEKLRPAEMDWIGSLARHSTHPNSVRLTRVLSFTTLPVTNFKETPGGGISGEVAGHEILLGAQKWIESFLKISAVKNDSTLVSAGMVAVAIDGQCRGRFALKNTLRPEVESLIGQLGGRFQLALLSGDNDREAEKFQKLFGEKAILKFNQSPADKLDFISGLQRGGRKVMMVGDGLNDAGALKQADVGVAVVERVGVFSPASDVILDAAQLPQLAQVLDFSRRATRIVRASFGISAIYNLGGVSIAAAGLLSPMVCAILMPLSSATVVAFACGTTTWLGRKLNSENLRFAEKNNFMTAAADFQPQPLTKGTA